MKIQHRIVMVVLAGMLLLSLGINFYLFNRGKGYYVELNETRLNPLNIDAFPVETPAIQNAQPLIMFYGDSRAMSWPIPDGLDHLTFLNRGIGAQTSNQVWLRFPQHVAPVKPQAIIMQVGINDLKTIPLFPDRKQAIITACKENIRQIVSAATDLKGMIVLTTIFPVGRIPLERLPFWSDDVRLAVNEVNDYIHTLADPQIIILDAFAILAEQNGLMNPEYSEDELHINAAGYTALNEALTPMLVNFSDTF